MALNLHLTRQVVPRFLGLCLYTPLRCGSTRIKIEKLLSGFRYNKCSGEVNAIYRLQNLTLALSLWPYALRGHYRSPVAHAQTNTTGAVVGVVSDSTGAFIPGAKVIVTNQATGAAYTVTTSSVGDYRVSQLAPGAYSITVEAKGFEGPSRSLT